MVLGRTMFVVSDGTRAGEDIDPDVLLAKVDSMHKDMLEDMIENMDITDRVFWGKYYEQCFTGETAVQFLLENKYAVDAQDAVYLGVYLMNRGVLRHVCNEHEFQNARLFYRFVQK